MLVAYNRRLQLPDYVCGECHKGRRKKIKLWRLHNVMMSHQRLRCVDCASRQAGLDPQAVNEEGLSRDAQYGTGTVSSMIGSLWTPAIPSDVVDGHIDNYWGRSSVPPEGVAWWRALPLR